MIKVLSTEMRKYFYGRALYICLVVVAVIPLIEFGFMTLSSIMGPGERITQAFIDQFLNASGDQIFKYLYYVLFNGGSLFIASAVMTTIIVAEDYVQGTKKFMLMFSTRSRLAGGKLMTLFVVNTLLHFTGVGVSLVIAGLTRGSFNVIYSTSLLLVYVLIGWLVTLAFSFLVALIGGYVRNVAASLAIGIGVYLIGWAFAIYLPDSMRAYIFMNGAMLIGNAARTNLDQAVAVGAISFIAFATLLYRRMRFQCY